jgi:hypothetical protein
LATVVVVAVVQDQVQAQVQMELQQHREREPLPLQEVAKEAMEVMELVMVYQALHQVVVVVVE